MSETKYCTFAFNAIGIDIGRGGCNRICCLSDRSIPGDNSKHELLHFNKPLDWVNNDDSVNLRQHLLDNKWHPICSFCETYEKHGAPSIRQRFIINEAEETNAILSDLSSIFILDITLDNICNNSCVTCSERYSSMWTKEQEEINGIEIS